MISLHSSSCSFDQYVRFAMPRRKSAGASRSSGRAEEPAAAALELAPCIESSAVFLANSCASDRSYTDAFRFSAMNVGWQINYKRHTAEWFYTAVEDVIQVCALDALGLTQIFEINDNSEVATVRKQNLLQTIVGRLIS